MWLSSAPYLDWVGPSVVVGPTTVGVLVGGAGSWAVGCRPCLMWRLPPAGGWGWVLAWLAAGPGAGAKLLVGRARSQGSWLQVVVVSRTVLTCGWVGLVPGGSWGWCQPNGGQGQVLGHLVGMPGSPYGWLLGLEGSQHWHRLAGGQLSPWH